LPEVKLAAARKVEAARESAAKGEALVLLRLRVAGDVLASVVALALVGVGEDVVGLGDVAELELEGGALGVRTGFNSSTNVGSHCGVSCHQGLGFEHGLRFSPHGDAALRQQRGHPVEGFPDAARLGFSITRARRVRRRSQGFRHAQNNASRNSLADSRTA
jgi:hypothetical protein